MSENKPTMPVDIIPYDSIIDIQVGGAFYGRIHELILYIAQQKEPQEFLKIMNELKEREPKEPFEFHMITLLALVREIEEKAKEQNKIQKKDIPIPTDPSSPKVDP